MEVLVTGIVGMIGIRPTIAAIEAGKDIALANKETLVTAGHIHYAACEEQRRFDPAGGQRAQCDFPVHARGKPGAGGEDSAHGVGRSFPGKEKGRACGHDGGGRAQASQLVYGEKGDHRLRVALQ